MSGKKISNFFPSKCSLITLLKLYLKMVILKAANDKLLNFR